jgi:hypothetical protein
MSAREREGREGRQADRQTDGDTYCVQSSTKGYTHTHTHTHKTHNYPQHTQRDGGPDVEAEQGRQGMELTYSYTHVLDILVYAFTPLLSCLIYAYTRVLIYAYTHVLNDACSLPYVYIRIGFEYMSMRACMSTCMRARVS